MLLDQPYIRPLHAHFHPDIVNVKHPMNTGAYKWAPDSCLCVVNIMLASLMTCALTEPRVSSSRSCWLSYGPLQQHAVSCTDYIWKTRRCCTLLLMLAGHSEDTECTASFINYSRHRHRYARGRVRCARPRRETWQNCSPKPKRTRCRNVTQC